MKDSRGKYVVPRKRPALRPFAAVLVLGEAVSIVLRRYGVADLLTMDRGWARRRIRELGRTHRLVTWDLGETLVHLFPQPFPSDLHITVADGEPVRVSYAGVPIWGLSAILDTTLADAAVWFGIQPGAAVILLVAEWLEAWAGEHGAALTGRLGSLAVDVWLAGLRQEIPRARPGDEEWGRAALYPGRAEVWARGEHEVRVYDVNSLYPSVMAGAEFPDPRSGERCDHLRGDRGFERWRLRVPEGAVPVLPYRTRAGEVYYPTGEWTATYTTAELDSARMRGTELLEFRGSYYYSRMLPSPFAPFVRRLYRERREARRAGDVLAERLSKLALNALWGRLGLSGQGVSRIVRARGEDGIAYIPDPCGRCTACRSQRICERLRGARREGAYWLLPAPLGPSPDYVNAAWAAWITSLARLRLLALMERVGLNNVVRLHTDSVTTLTQAELLPTNRRLGGLKLEYSGPEDTRGVNAVRRATGARVAGVPREQADEYWAKGRVEVYRPLGLVEGLAAGKPGAWARVPVRLLQTRESRPDGGARPWRVDELEG